MVTGVVLLPPGSCLQFLSRIGFSDPTARRFSSSVANSRSRAFRKSICAQEKVPTNLYEYALGGARTHETDLYQARGQPDTPPGRPAILCHRPSVHLGRNSTSFARRLSYFELSCLMCTHVTQLRFGLNPACPSLIFSFFSSIVPILSFKILQNALPTVLNSIIPR